LTSPKGNLERIQIPLPPLEVQKEIVAEIEGYQNEIKRLQDEIEKNRAKIKKTIERV